MARTTRGRKGAIRRLLSPVVQSVGLLKNVGKSSLKFASNVLRSTGRRIRKTANNLRGKTRRNTKSQRRRR